MYGRITPNVVSATLAMVVAVTSPPASARALADEEAGTDARQDAGPGGAGQVEREASTAPARDRLDEAFAAHERGRARFEMADYGGAIEDFARAYQGLPSTPEHDARRRGVLWELVQAHLKAHAIDRDVIHLRLARDLLTSYLAALDPEMTQERDDARALQAELEVQLLLTEEEAAQAGARERASQDSPQGDAACTGEEREGACAGKRDATVRYEPHKPLPEGPRTPPGPSMLDVGKGYQRPELMLAMGSVLIGLGAVAGALVVLSNVKVNEAIVWWRTDYDRGDVANAQFHLYYPLMIGASVAGALFVAGGGALLGIGLRRKRTRRLAWTSGGLGLRW